MALPARNLSEPQSGVTARSRIRRGALGRFVASPRGPADSDSQRGGQSGLSHTVASLAIRCTIVVPTFRFRPIFSMAACSSCRPLMRSMSDRPSRSTDQAITTSTAWGSATEVSVSGPDACTGAIKPGESTAGNAALLPDLHRVDHAVRQRQFVVRVENHLLHVAAHGHVDRQRVGLPPCLRRNRDPLRIAG